MAGKVVTRALFVVLIACAGAASAWAATIHGTSHADVLRGTPHADVIDGRGGNDTLYGLAGNDKLYGGPGNDKLYGGPGNDLLVGGPGKDLLDCGPGHDIAIADRTDRLIGCEVVKWVGPPPTTTTAPVPTALPGHYCGFTSIGAGICFDVGGSPLVFSNAAFTVSFDKQDCNPPAEGTVSYTTGGSAPIQGDNSFTFQIASGDNAGTTVAGTVSPDGTGSGTLVLHSVLSSGGTTFTCALNLTWTATKQ